MTKMQNKMMNKIKPLMKILNKDLDGEENKGTDLYLYGDIGDGWWYEGITALKVRTALSRIDSDLVNVHIHSDGGDAFEGIAIHNIFKQSEKTIHVYIDGLAASAASIIALGGEKLYMPKNTQMMIHNASCFLYGEASDFEKMAVSLTNVNTSVRQTYLSRFTGSEEELIKYMDDQTFFTAEQAVALGLADEILDYDAQLIEDEIVDPDDEEDNTLTFDQGSAEYDLFLERCRYDWNNALDEFENNYSSEILSMIQFYALKDWREQNVESTY